MPCTLISAVFISMRSVYQGALLSFSALLSEGGAKSPVPSTVSFPSASITQVICPYSLSITPLAIFPSASAFTCVSSSSVSFSIIEEDSCVSVSAGSDVCVSDSSGSDVCMSVVVVSVDVSKVVLSSCAGVSVLVVSSVSCSENRAPSVASSVSCAEPVSSEAVSCVCVSCEASVSAANDNAPVGAKSVKSIAVQSSPAKSLAYIFLFIVFPPSIIMGDKIASLIQKTLCATR